jgi:hypothetical protein
MHPCSRPSPLSLYNMETVTLALYIGVTATIALCNTTTVTE